MFEHKKNGDKIEFTRTLTAKEQAKADYKALKEAKAKPTTIAETAQRLELLEKLLDL
jgi:hypothetical protein